MRVPHLAAACAAAVLCLGVTKTAHSAVMLVESRAGGQNFSDYADSGAGFPNSWANSTAKSTAPGVTAGIGTRFNSTAGAGGAATWFEVSPLLDLAGGEYFLDVTVTEDSGTLAVISTVVVTNGTLTGTDVDLIAPGFQTDAFSNVAPANATANTWNRVGLLTLDPGETTPIVRFEETVNGPTPSTSRFYADAVRFDSDSIPEPASLALVAFSSLAALRRRRV